MKDLGFARKILKMNI